MNCCWEPHHITNMLENQMEILSELARIRWLLDTKMHGQGMCDTRFNVFSKDRPYSSWSDNNCGIFVDKIT